jgi:hypothetical protein
MSDQSLVAENNGNGKVTLAVLGQRLDQNNKLLEQLLEKFDHHIEQANVRDNRLTILETKFADIETMKKVLMGGAFALIGLLVTAVVVLVRAIGPGLP